MELARICPYTKFEVYSFNRFRFTEGGLKFNFWSLDPNHAMFGGYFVMLQMGLAKVYLYIKFEVSIFTRSRFMEEGLKFKILVLDPDHAPFGGILS